MDLNPREINKEINEMIRILNNLKEDNCYYCNGVMISDGIAPMIDYLKWLEGEMVHSEEEEEILINKIDAEIEEEKKGEVEE